MSNLDKLYIFLVLGVIAFIVYEVANIGDKVDACAGWVNLLTGNCDPAQAEANKQAQAGYTNGANIPCTTKNYIAGNCTDTSGGDCGFIAFIDGGCTSNSAD